MCEVLTKICNKCNVGSPLLEFSKTDINKDGLSNYCKECESKRAKVYQEKNKARETITVPGFKTCPGCKTEKLGSGFFNDNASLIQKAIDYLKSPTTGILYRKSWGKAGVSKSIREQILASQNYMCKICSVDLHIKRPELDHDHLTMMVRGYLCHGCNCGIGGFGDSIELLTNAINYLLKHKEVLDNTI